MRSAVAVVIQLVLADLAAQRVAVYSQDFGGARLIALGAVQDPFRLTYL